MKAIRLSSMLFASALLLSASAFAGSMNKKTLHLYDNARIEGKLLHPGDYKVEWSGPGPKVELNIIQGRMTVATVPGQIVSERSAYDSNGYVLRSLKNGDRAIDEIFFSGKKYDLKIEPTGKAS
jgi:hypothetical protein